MCAISAGHRVHVPRSQLRSVRSVGEDGRRGRRSPPRGDLKLAPLRCSSALLRARPLEPGTVPLGDLPKGGAREPVAPGYVLGPSLGARLSYVTAHRAVRGRGTRGARLSNASTHDLAISARDDSHDNGMPELTAPQTYVAAEAVRRGPRTSGMRRARRAGAGQSAIWFSSKPRALPLPVGGGHLGGTSAVQENPLSWTRGTPEFARLR